MVKAYEAYNNAETKTTTEIDALYKSVYDFYVATQPVLGDFYRLRSRNNDNYMVNGDYSNTTKDNRATMGSVSTRSNTDEAFRNSVYYYQSDDDALINYINGLVIDDYFDLAYYDANDVREITWAHSKYYINTFTFVNTTNPDGTRYMWSGWEDRVDRNGKLMSTGETDWRIEEVTDLPVKLNSYGYATLYCPKSLTVPTGVTAYTIGYNSDLTETTVISTYEAGSVLPAGTAVLLETTSDDLKGAYADFPIVDDEGTASAQHYMTGEVYTHKMNEGAYYGLSGNKFYRVEISSTDDDANYINGSRAYLDATGAAGSAAMIINLLNTDDITAIGKILSSADEADAPYYDLQGRRVSNPQRGVYIRGGRKVYIK